VGGTQAYNSDSYVGSDAFAVGGDSSGHGYAVGNANPTNRNRIDAYDLGGGEEKNEIPISSDTMGILLPIPSVRLVPYPCPTESGIRSTVTVPISIPIARVGNSPLSVPEI